MVESALTPLQPYQIPNSKVLEFCTVKLLGCESANLAHL